MKTHVCCMDSSTAKSYFYWTWVSTKKLEQNRYIADGILKRISLTSVMLEIKFIGACMIHRAWINKDTIKIKIHH